LTPVGFTRKPNPRKWVSHRKTSRPEAGLVASTMRFVSPDMNFSQRA
jgi:hypothetical protein